MAKKRSQKMLEQLAYGHVNDALKMLVEICPIILAFNCLVAILRIGE